MLLYQNINSFSYSEVDEAKTIWYYTYVQQLNKKGSKIAPCITIAKNSRQVGKYRTGYI